MKERKAPNLLPKTQAQTFNATPSTIYMSGTVHTAIVIAGPTCSGKTAVATEIARKLGTAIVSADSRQCYEGMSIGTAQPTAEELAMAKHYFVNCFPITTALTVADYEQLALGYLQEIFAQHNTAIVCGGTGLYIKALTDGIDAMPPTDPTIEAEVNNNYQQHGLSWLQEQVLQADPEFYITGEIHNPARLVRALIFKLSTGQSITEYRTGVRKERPFRIIKVGLELPRAELYARINHRVDVMMQQGLEAEVAALLPYRQLKNLQTVGYAELIDYMVGKCPLAQATDKIKQHTRNYAKRQLTWFKRDPDYTWFRADDADVADKIITLSGL